SAPATARGAVPRRPVGSEKDRVRCAASDLHLGGGIRRLRPRVACRVTFATLGALSVVRHLRRQRMRVVLSVTGVMLGVALVVATGTLATSAVQSMERVFETLLGPASIDVTGGDPGLPEELVSLVETVPGVADAAPVLFASVDVPDAPGIPLTVLRV